MILRQSILANIIFLLYTAICAAIVVSAFQQNWAAALGFSFVLAWLYATQYVNKANHCEQEMVDEFTHKVPRELRIISMIALVLLYVAIAISAFLQNWTAVLGFLLALLWFSVAQYENKASHCEQEMMDEFIHSDAGQKAFRDWQKNRSE